MAEVETTTTVQETVVITSETTSTVVCDGVKTEEVTVTTIETTGDSHGLSQEEKAQDGVEEVKENGDVEPAKEDEAVPAETTEAVEAPKEEAAEKIEVQEEKKEEGPPKVILHQYPPGKNIPSVSTFCLKLETFLRMNKIPYENVHSFKVGKKGKMPWIEYKGEKVADSNFIIAHLSKVFEIDMDKDLNQSDKAQSRAFKAMMEENTYHTLVYNRLIDEYQEWKKILGVTSKGIGFTVSFKMNQRKARSALDQQGIGRHTKDEIYHLAEQDLRALSDFLGEKAYFMGVEATTIDATAFGLLANIVYCGLESPQFKLMKEELKNLADYVERVKSEFWADWQDVVLGDKPETTNIPRRFSFKRGKKKPKVTKKDREESSDGEDKAAEESKPEEKVEEASKPEEAATEEATSEETKPEEAKPEEAKVEESEPEKTTDEAPAEETVVVNGDATEKEKEDAEAKTD